MTYMRAWMSSKFWTIELAALGHLKIRCYPFFSFHSCGLIYLGNSQVSVYRSSGYVALRLRRDRRGKDDFSTKCTVEYSLCRVITVSVVKINKVTNSGAPR